jgi:hypothetical protein
MEYIDEPIQFISINTSSENESPRFLVSEQGIKFFESLNEKKVIFIRLLLLVYLAQKKQGNHSLPTHY